MNFANEIFEKISWSKFFNRKNVIKKILGLKNFKNRNIIEIGPGRGALTDEILKKNLNL